MPFKTLFGVTNLLKDYGVDALRLRVFVNPPASGIWEKEITCMLGYNDKEHVLKMALRAKELGFRIMVDFHYSDYFADPSVQIMPQAWQGHDFQELLADVYNHTTDVMQLLGRHGIVPEWVQIGNEINNGIMHPVGSAKDGFPKLAALLNRGYEATKAVSPESKVITHLAEGQDPEASRYFFDQFLLQYGGKTDILGLSYYPYWIGSDYTVTMDKLKKNLYGLMERYGKDVMVCEIGGDENDPDNSYAYAKAVIELVKGMPDNRGKGVFWWEPEGNSAFLPDRYPLGATRVVGEKELQFTRALEAFRKAEGK